MDIDQQTARAFADLRWSVCSERLFTTLPGVDLRQVRQGTAWELINNWADNEIYQQNLIQQLAATKSTRLGVYYENLWRFYLSHCGNTTLLQHNLQVNEGGRTVGEFDFIYRDQESQSTVHMETAIKFYLGVPGKPDSAAGTGHSGSQWKQWVGPGLQDRLDLKLNQLSHKQLRLQSAPGARAALIDLGVEAGMECELQMAGRLFYPVGGMHSPTGVNPLHEKGRWFSVSQLLTHYLPVTKDGFAARLNRAEWLCPLTLSADSSRVMPSLALVDDIRQTLTKNREFQPFQFCQLQRNKDCWEEEFRAFVVPDTWFDKAVTASSANIVRDT